MWNVLSWNLTYEATADKSTTQCLGNLQSLPINFWCLCYPYTRRNKTWFLSILYNSSNCKTFALKGRRIKVVFDVKKPTIKRYTEKGHSAFRDLNQAAWDEWELIFIAKSVCNSNLINASKGKLNKTFQLSMASLVTTRTKGEISLNSHFRSNCYHSQLVIKTRRGLQEGMSWNQCQMQTERNLLWNIFVSLCFYLELLTAFENN